MVFSIHGGSMKSKPNFVFHISTSNMKTVFNIFVKKLSVVWFDYLIKEDVQNVHLLLARRLSLEALAPLGNVFFSAR